MFQIGCNSQAAKTIVIDGGLSTAPPSASIGWVDGIYDFAPRVIICICCVHQPIRECTHNYLSTGINFDFPTPMNAAVVYCAWRVFCRGAYHCIICVKCCVVCEAR